MESHPPTATGTDWSRAVHVTEDSELTVELRARLERGSGRRAVSVTDLLAMRRAFWRVTGPPVPVPEQRRARMQRGRLLHRVLGATLASEGSLEVRVRKDGLVGRLDALTDRPIEIKTSAAAVAAEALRAERPEYLEQLGMYCALLGRTTGRILSLALRDDGGLDGVECADVHFRRPDAILSEMHRRAEALRASWQSGRADGLPRCPWFDRGCEYRAGPICDCTGTEAIAASPILGELESVLSRPDVAERLRRSLEERLGRATPPSIERFRDLVYPRRAYFERTRRPPEDVAPSASPTLSETYARLLEAVEGGPVGEVARLPELAPEPEEEVPAFRDEPYLARTSRARRPPSSAELVDRSPQYALELGFRCAATGRAAGRVIVAYERPESATDQLRVYRVEFSPISTLARLWREREASLRAALASHSPETLPACPSWMFEDCPYRSECGCGGEPGRSQR